MHHLKFVHLLCQEHVKEGSSLVDATMGNGHDTLFLAKLIEKHEKSTLIAYDIQEMALQSTRARLNTHNLLNRVQLKMSCHTHIEDDFSLDSIDLTLFNLGYLPHSDKKTTTLAKNTIKACTSTLNKLKANGLLIIVVYPGHPNGKLEALELDSWSKKINKFTRIKFKDKLIQQI